MIGDINDSVFWLTFLEIFRLKLTSNKTKLFSLEIIYNKGCHICLPAVNTLGCCGHIFKFCLYKCFGCIMADKIVTLNLQFSILVMQPTAPWNDFQIHKFNSRISKISVLPWRNNSYCKTLILRPYGRPCQERSWQKPLRNIQW